ATTGGVVCAGLSCERAVDTRPTAGRAADRSPRGVDREGVVVAVPVVAVDEAVRVVVLAVGAGARGERAALLEGEVVRDHRVADELVVAAGLRALLAGAYRVDAGAAE